MKWIGALLLISASHIVGRMLANEESQPLNALNSMLDLLSRMRRRISLELTPLNAFFAEYEDLFLEACGFLPTMRSHRSSLPLLWRDAVSNLPTDDVTKRELIHFGAELGSLPLEEQVKRIDSCLIVLTEARNRLRDTLPQKQKSIKTVCMLVGLFASIILI